MQYTLGLSIPQPRNNWKLNHYCIKVVFVATVTEFSFSLRSAIARQKALLLDGARFSWQMHHKHKKWNRCFSLQDIAKKKKFLLSAFMKTPAPSHLQ